MLISCWSAKGGSGTTVVSAALALVLARRSTAGALLVDVAADAAPVLGVPDPDGAGVLDWLAAGERATPDALGRLEVEVGAGLSLLRPGAGDATDARRVPVLAGLLAADDRPVVADCGTLGSCGRWDDGVRTALAEAATHSLLVLRPCYLALRRAIAAPLAPTGAVVVREPGRALGPAEVEEVLGVPVVACIDVDPSIARAVDAGLLVARLPRGLTRPLADVA